MSDSFVEIGQLHDTILVIDFGSEYTHLIVRQIRELHVYCEWRPCTVSLNELSFVPRGIILSGGPSSVYDPEAPHVRASLFQCGIPILGICYGQQEMAWHLGGHVARATTRGYGHASLRLIDNTADALVKDLPSTIVAWMSHGDQVVTLPPGFEVLAQAESAPIAAMSCAEQRLYAIQFHPEVTHTPMGKTILRNFVVGICQCRTDWTMASFIDTEIDRLCQLIGEQAHVVGAVSGGVDSTVAASLLHRAIGNRFHAILIDHGFMRLNEVAKVRVRLEEKLGISLRVVDAADRFFAKLEGVTDPEVKRKHIGNLFIELFEEEALRLGGEQPIEYLLQGTLYSDVIESSFQGSSSVTIKSHHNVGGLLSTMKLKLIEPLRELFKDEVRSLGAVMGIDDELLWRHPFPGPGLAIRILGVVTREQVQMLQRAEAIFIEEIRKAGLYRSIAQAFAVLLPIKTVGVMGDQRTYEQVIALRAVETTDFMTATWYPMPYDVLRQVSSRIVNEISGINRVTYDISSKPPSTIEWE